MKIFRLETLTGAGPWRGGEIETLYAGFCYNSLSDFHPAPEDDGLGFAPIARWKFGCDSLEQLRYWFLASTVNRMTGKYPTKQAARYQEKDLEQLTKAGYQITVYEVDEEFCEYGESLKQLAFKPEVAKVSDRIPLHVLFA